MAGRRPPANMEATTSGAHPASTHMRITAANRWRASSRGEGDPPPAAPIMQARLSPAVPRALWAARLASSRLRLVSCHLALCS